MAGDTSKWTALRNYVDREIAATSEIGCDHACRGCEDTAEVYFAAAETLRGVRREIDALEPSVAV